MSKRSHEPIFWSLFGAGGVLTAMLLPAIVFVTGLAVPLGLLTPDAIGYERAAAFAGGWAGKLFLLAVISLTLWHAVHRIYHSLHDLGIHAGLPLFKLLAYGSAFAGTVVTAVFLISIG